jgi:L-asparaginase
VQGKYETSSQLKRIGVIGGGDLTFEAAITKLMYLLGKGLKGKQLTKELQQNIAGELTVN